MNSIYTLIFRAIHVYDIPKIGTWWPLDKHGLIGWSNCVRGLWSEHQNHGYWFIIWMSRSYMNLQYTHALVFRNSRYVSREIFLKIVFKFRSRYSVVMRPSSWSTVMQAFVLAVSRSVSTCSEMRSKRKQKEHNKHK